MQQRTTMRGTGNASWQTRFEEWVPRIRRLACFAFRGCSLQLREEAVAEVVADVFCALRRLVTLGREDDAHLSVLVGYSIKRVKSGVQAGTSRNRFDVMAYYSRLRSGLRVESLDCIRVNNEWQELIVSSRRSTPAEIAILRLDIESWMSSLSERNRMIATMLAAGYQTSDVARVVRLTPGRVSQLRHAFFVEWQRRHGFDIHGRELQPVAA